MGSSGHAADRRRRRGPAARRLPLRDAGAWHRRPGRVALPEGRRPSPRHPRPATRRHAHRHRSATALALATEPALINRVEEIVLMTGAWCRSKTSPPRPSSTRGRLRGAGHAARMRPPGHARDAGTDRPGLVTPARIAALRAAGGGALPRRRHASVPTSRRFAHQGHPLHDPCAIAWLLDPALFTTAT